MDNKRGRPKAAARYRVMICMSKEEYEMLSKFADMEKRPKSNAALFLVRDSLQARISGYRSEAK